MAAVFEKSEPLTENTGSKKAAVLDPDIPGFGSDQVLEKLTQGASDE